MEPTRYPTSELIRRRNAGEPLEDDEDKDALPRGKGNWLGGYFAATSPLSLLALGDGGISSCRFCQGMKLVKGEGWLFHAEHYFHCLGFSHVVVYE